MNGDKCIEIMMEDEKAETPLGCIATLPRSECVSHWRSPSPYSGSSPAGVELPVLNFIHHITHCYGE